MRNIIILFFNVVTGIAAYSQAAMPDNLRAASTLDRLTNFQGNNTPDMLYGIPMPPGKVIGDTYLSTDWKIATVLLYADNKIIEGFPTRYDIGTNELEFNAKNGVKALSGEKVKSFVWIDSQTNTPSYFVNAKEFKNIDNVPFIGFFQILSDGTLPLMKRTKITVKKADYNAALNVGSPDDKILKSEELCYSKENKVFKMPGSNKKAVPVFGDKAAEIKKFIDENSLSVGKEEDLIKIFDHFNSLTKK
jgi:hypothetical protein